MRTIRRHGTPLPDSEKGSIGGRSYEEEPTSVLTTFKNAFRKANQESPPRQMEISRPVPNSYD
jgi:hypothetical protein